jgi:hypothetical protein
VELSLNDVSSRFSGVAEYPGATGKASNPRRFTFHVYIAELGLVNP